MTECVNHVPQPYTFARILRSVGSVWSSNALSSSIVKMYSRNSLELSDGVPNEERC
jgi:hypothetical protein